MMSTKLLQLIKWLSLSVLLLATGLPLLNANAQEEVVELALEIYLQVEGQEPQLQTEAAYDLVDVNGEIVASSDDDSMAMILSPGDYRLYLYDGGQFMRNDQAVRVARVTQTIANQTETDQANGRTEKLQDQLGELLQDEATDQFVYEIPFRIMTGPSLAIGESGLPQSVLKIYLADEISYDEALFPQANEKRPDGSADLLDDNLDQEADDPLESEETTDEESKEESEEPVNDENLNDTQSLTDNSAESKSETDLDQEASDQTPTESQENTSDDINESNDTDSHVDTPQADEQTSTEDSHALTSSTETASLTIQLITSENEPVVGGQLSVDETNYTTDDQGEINISELMPGRYTYAVTSLPDGYNGELEDEVQLSAGESLTLAVTVHEDEASEFNDLIFQIKDTKQTPIAEAVVTIDGEWQETTDSDGQAIFADLIVGEIYHYTIELPKPYDMHIEKDLTLTEQEGGMVVVQDEIELPEERLNLPLVIQDQDGQPVADVVVQLEEQTLTTDADGQVTFTDLAPGDYQYQVIEWPADFDGQVDATITLEESLDEPVILTVDRIPTPGKAILTVVDSDDQPVSQVTVKFGGLTKTTDVDGQVTFTDLDLGNYYYQVIEVPDGYELTEEQKAEITEDATFTDQLRLKKIPTDGQVVVSLVNSDGQPLTGAAVRIQDQEVQTDDKGQAIFNHLVVGETDYYITELPADQTVEKSTGQVTVTADQTVTMTVATTETTSNSSEDQTTTPPPVADRSLRELIDEDTQITIKVAPEDAEKVARFKVETLTPPDSFDANLTQAYRLSLIGRDDQPVDLSKVAHVEFPIAKDHKLTQVLRWRDDYLATILTSQIDQAVQFQTQQLGDFIVETQSTHADAEDPQETNSQSSQVTVTKTTDQEKADLPKTGESAFILVLSAVLLLCGSYFVLDFK